MKAVTAICVMSSLLLSTTQLARADILVDQALDFGTIAIVKNDVSGSYEIDRYGNTSYSSNFGILTPAQPAVFRLVGFPPFSRQFINVVELGGNMNPGEFASETFSLSITDFDNSVVMDALGEGNVRAGGVITTSGSGVTAFSALPYQVQIRITVNN